MIAVTFNIRLLQPLLVTQPGSDDETGARSSDYIPGSVLRNALAARYIRARALGDPAADPACRRLFFSEATRFLNALPLVNGRPSLPVPLSWYADKKSLADFIADSGKSIEVCDAALDDQPLNNMAEARPFARDGRLCAPDPTREKSGALEVAVAREVAIHIQRANKRLLETKHDTQVYTYQALSAGQSFFGAIVAPDAETAGTFSDMLQGLEISIGGSRTAGYGRMRFESVTVRDDWRGYEWPGEDDEDADKIVITLLSDAIVRDPLTGQYCEDLTPIFHARPEAMYRRTRLVGGFNRKWSLPRPQAYVIQAGSVFVYDRTAISADDLARAASEGIGERRCDGFGHIAVNWQRDTTVTITRPARPDQAAIETLTDPEARAVAQMILDRAQRRRLDQKLIQAVMRFAEGARGRATTSALARVRVEARRAGFNKSDLSGLRRLLGDMKNGDRPKAAAKSLNEIRVQGKGLYDWLCELVSQPDANSQDDRLSKLLGDDPNMNLAIGDVKPVPVVSLTNEYIARFIEGLTHQLIRQEKRAREEA